MDDNTLKAILEKGLELLVKSSGVKFIYPFVPFGFTFDEDTGDLVAISSENQNSTYFITINLVDKSVRISEL